MIENAPTVLITGTSRGIGLEFVRQYAEDNWNVIACCRTPAKAAELQNLAEKYKGIQIEQLDVTDDANIKALAEKLKDRPLDLLINGAGIFSGANCHITASDKDESQMFGSLDSESWMRVLRTNTISPIMVSEAFQKNLAQSNSGTLISISSRMGSIEHIYRIGDLAYRTSKAALNAAMKSISINLKSQNTIVACIHPGWVRTDMGGQGAELTPERSVAAMRQTIASLRPENSGQFFTYDGQLIPW